MERERKGRHSTRSQQRSASQQPSAAAASIGKPVISNRQPSVSVQQSASLSQQSSAAVGSQLPVSKRAVAAPISQLLYKEIRHKIQS